MTGVSLAMLLKVLQSIKSTEDQDKVSLQAEVEGGEERRYMRYMRYGCEPGHAQCASEREVD